MKKFLYRVLYTILILAFLGISEWRLAKAQIATPGSSTVIQLMDNQTVSAGSSKTATLAAVSGKYTCLQDALITLDVPTSGSVGVSGTVTISDGTWTVGMLCLDTFSSGAWCEYYGPVLQSSAVNTSIVVTVPAYTNGGAGNVHVVGYSNPGGC